MGLYEQIKEAIMINFLKGLQRRFSLENLKDPKTWAGLITLLTTAFGKDYIPVELHEAFIQAGVAFSLLLIAWMNRKKVEAPLE